MSSHSSTSILIAGVLAVAATARADKAENSPKREPAAMAALDRMGAFLRDQQSFTVRTTVDTEYVLDSGQKIRLSSRGDLRVRRPDRMRAEVVSDRKERQYFYDGKTMTVFAPQVGYYASVAAPPRIIELADQLQDRYGLELPLVDLFRWGTDESTVEDITSAKYIGTAKIDGVDTDQYAFRQPGLDWQVWIERGGNPLPRKLVLTTTDDPARPERVVELTWDLGTKHDNALFTFVPPKDAKQIPIAKTPGSRVAEKK